MTRSDQLRQALDDFDQWPDPDSAEPWELVMTAARSWLNLQEGDEQLVEKVADVLHGDPLPRGGRCSAHDDLARAVLAAIVGEET